MSEGGDGLLVDSARLGDVEGGKLQVRAHAVFTNHPHVHVRHIGNEPLH